MTLALAPLLVGLSVFSACSGPACSGPDCSDPDCGDPGRHERLSLGAPADEALTSGAPMPAEQAAIDVSYYGLDLTVDPKKKAIAGTLTLRAVVVSATPALVLDLDDRLDVKRVRSGGDTLRFRHSKGRLRIQGGDRFTEVGATIEVTVEYGGEPRVAPKPPWDGGFTWAETKAGEPWIATSCQGEGADLWWPCKDQPSDEADTMDIVVTVPEPLVVASNGKLLGVEDAPRKGWRTYRWHVSTPINNYGVALNIAPYVELSMPYTSTAGDELTVTYWCLPENEEQGREILPEFCRHLRFFEETFGPYPFRADKYGVAETPHLGMEHQTIIAYGNRYRGNPWGPQQGFDFLHHHELAHEWWGNLVTAENWKDFWIHESFAQYSQALYVEKLHGQAAYFDQMKVEARRILNKGAIAPRDWRSTNDMYFDSGRADAPDADIYFKGAWVLHTLRWLVGDEDFFRILRRMCYPDPALEATTDGSACRFATTEEFIQLAERESGRDLGWFFEVYLRQPELPRLVEDVRGRELRLRWEVPIDVPFPLPVPVRIGGELQRVELSDGAATVPLGRDREFTLDPQGWLLRAGGEERRR